MELRNYAGNEPLKRTLSGVERPSHAIIISGPAGSGRHMLAGILAQAHVCTGSRVPCGVCRSCRQAAQGIHPDVMSLSAFVDPAELEKDVRVGTIRAIRSDAQIRPNQAPRKVYLIDRPINPNAQNAMLKLLEEGPAYAAFLLITENAQTLLETVRSRCMKLSTAPVEPEQVMEVLRQRYPNQPEELLRSAAQSCEGLIGRAVRQVEGAEEDGQARERADQWLEALLRGSELDLMELAVSFQTEKQSRTAADALYAAIAAALRDGMVCASGAMDSPDPLSERLARSIPVPRMMELYGCAQRAREMCLSNVNPAHSAGWLAVKLAGG